MQVLAARFDAIAAISTAFQVSGGCCVIDGETAAKMARFAVEMQQQTERAKRAASTCSAKLENLISEGFFK